MKILHLPVAYLPGTTGGREVYCHALCRALGRLGIQNEVTMHRAPDGREPAGRREHEGVPVHVLPALPEADGRRAWYSRRFPALPGFAEALAEIRPNIVHFHDQGGGASLSHLEAVKARGIPVVLTCHSPGQTCPETELLRNGRDPCDGEVRLGRCTACRLVAAGVPRPAALVAAAADWPGVDPWSEAPAARVLTARRMTRLFRNALREFIRAADVIVVLAEWSRQVWLRNGCPPAKLRLVRSGAALPPAPPPRSPRPNGPLRVACLGRCDRTKGFDVLIAAVRSQPDLAVEVHWFGPYWDNDYGAELRRRMADDARFRPPRLVPHGELAGALGEMDLVVIPSRWLETGPLTRFDARSAGLPVVASRLGGLEETVRDRVDGRLFPPGDSAALGEILAELARQPSRLDALRPAGANRPRTFDDIAAEMSIIYRGLAPAG